MSLDAEVQPDPTVIDRFIGEYRFLSNFWFCRIKYEGETYKTVEHAYQAAKTNDRNQKTLIRASQRPAHAKHLGKSVTLRPNWDGVKRAVMYDLLKIKFGDHDELGHMLFQTGSKNLIEGNDWNDTYWGVCKGVGQNHLGLLLMRVRTELGQERGLMKPLE